MRAMPVCVMVVMAFAANARAQQQPAPAPAPPAAPAGPAAPAPAADAVLQDASPYPPITRPPPPSPPPAPPPAAPPKPPAQPKEPPADDDADRNVLELHTNGFLGSLSGGLFAGFGTRKVTWGLGFSVNYAKLGERSETAYALAPGGRFALAQAAGDRVDLVVDLDVGYAKRYITDNEGFVGPDGNAWFADLGPGLRLWVTRNLALSYVGLLNFTAQRDRNQNVVTLNGNLQRIGQVDPSTRSREATFVFFSGQLQLAGYF